MRRIKIGSLFTILIILFVPTLGAVESLNIDQETQPAHLATYTNIKNSDNDFEEKSGDDVTKKIVFAILEEPYELEDWGDAYYIGIDAYWLFLISLNSDGTKDIAYYSPLISLILRGKILPAGVGYGNIIPGSIKGILHPKFIMIQFNQEPQSIV